MNLLRRLECWLFPWSIPTYINLGGCGRWRMAWHFWTDKIPGVRERRWKKYRRIYFEKTGRRLG